MCIWRWELWWHGVHVFGVSHLEKVLYHWHRLLQYHLGRFRSMGHWLQTEFLLVDSQQMYVVHKLFCNTIYKYNIWQLVTHKKGSTELPTSDLMLPFLSTLYWSLSFYVVMTLNTVSVMVCRTCICYLSSFIWSLSVYLADNNFDQSFSSIMTIKRMVAMWFFFFLMNSFSVMYIFYGFCSCW